MSLTGILNKNSDRISIAAAAIRIFTINTAVTVLNTAHLKKIFSSEINIPAVTRQMMLPSCITAEKIRLIEYNLLSDQKAEFVAAEGQISNTRTYIKGSITDMQSLLVDVENNIPKDEAFFKKVEDDRIRERCNFRKVCV